MIGILIGDIRKASGISVEKLIRGLCSKGMFRKYETGVMEPEKLLADALFQRLGKSMDKYDVLLDNDEYELATGRANIVRLLTEARFDEAKAALEEYVRCSGGNQPLHLQFIALEQAELLRRQKADLKEQEKTILYGLSQTMPEAEDGNVFPSVLSQYRFSLMEIYLLQRLAVCREQQGAKLQAYEWHREILYYLEEKTNHKKKIEYDRTDYQKIYPFSAYHIAKFYAEQGQGERALEMIEKSCAVLGKSMEQSALFAHTMELKFQILEQLGQPVPEGERKCFALFCECIGKNYALWWEDWYPVYMERHIFSVSIMIRERRRAYGWSEEDLAENFCDARTIQRIENGQCMPRRKTRDILLSRLGVSTEKYDGGLVSGRYEDYKRYGRIVNGCNLDNISEAEKSLNELRQDISNKLVTNHQFISFWHLYISKRKKEISEADFCKSMWNLLKETVPIGEDMIQPVFGLMKHEREAFKLIMWWENEWGTNVQKLVEEQYKTFNAKPYRDFFKEYRNELLYCTGMIFRSRKEYDKGCEIMDRGLEELPLLHEDLQWGRLIFLRARIEEEKIKNRENGDVTRFFHLLRSAYAVCRLYVRDNYMQKFLCGYTERNYPQEADLFHDLMY